jgi:hypothetical protein
LPFPRGSNPYYRPSRMNWRKAIIMQRLTGRAAVGGAIAADSSN